MIFIYVKIYEVEMIFIMSIIEEIFIMIKIGGKMIVGIMIEEITRGENMRDVIMIGMIMIEEIEENLIEGKVIIEGKAIIVGEIMILGNMIEGISVEEIMKGGIVIMIEGIFIMGMGY